MEALSVIARNYPWCPDWDEKSFCGQIHENGIWSLEEYWLLELALVQMSSRKEDDHDLRRRLFQIFSSTLFSISCHFDRNDQFRITNLKRPKVYEFRERLQLVFEGYFSGKIPANLNELFEDRNPFLETGN